MEEKIYQTIIDRLVDYLPDGWKTVIFFAGYTDGSYSMKYFYETGDKNYLDCFSMSEVSKFELIKLFMEIDKILSVHRKEFGSDKAWTVFTMIVDSDGNMKTDYEYDDHSEDMIEYEKSWEEKYLV